MWSSSVSVGACESLGAHAGLVLRSVAHSKQSRDLMESYNTVHSHGPASGVSSVGKPEVEEHDLQVVAQGGLMLCSPRLPVFLCLHLVAVARGRCEAVSQTAGRRKGRRRKRLPLLANQ